MATDTPYPSGPHSRQSPWELGVGPSPDQWDDWVELDPTAWPTRIEKHYACVPTICFNCESACGLLAFIDKETGKIRKFEGNPVHPGSRGRTCAKGPATINQVTDTERILAPMKRVGPRGGGEWKEVTWDEALDDIGGRIRKAFDEERHNEVVYHVGRPGDDHFIMRMLGAWGIDGHNSHTNVCSAGARVGYALWFGADRPSPDYSQTKFMLLLSAHLETGHYFNPHAQRIISAKENGARLAVVDPRLSNTASHAHHWVSPWPGTEAAMLLGIANNLLQTDRVDHTFMKRWMNWGEFLAARDPDGDGTYERFIELLKEIYSEYTPEFVAHECKIPAKTVGDLADEIAAAEGHFASHLWRGAAAGHLGGWQIARSLLLLHALTGSIGRPGGLNPNSWDKFAPKPSENPPHHTRWNELLWPKEWPLAHYEMSFLMPHLMRDQDARVDTYFTRVYNPVWTNPDGATWVEMLEDEERVGCHVALTPIWSETAQWADYVLPMGLGPERHDLMSQETHAGTWIGFRQPVGREYMRRNGENPTSTLGTNPGQVWEEVEFWIALTWRIDPDGSLGMRKYYESKKNPGTPITTDEYYADIFDNVPGLPDAAGKEELTPLDYMKKYAAFDVPYKGQRRYEAPADDSAPGVDVPAVNDDGGVDDDNVSRLTGFGTPSRKLEFYSPTLTDWGYEAEAIPNFIRSQVHHSRLDIEGKERVLLPTFRLPTLIHTRSGNAKWLQEISHTNPLWVCPPDAEKLGLGNGDLVRVSTRIGYFVVRAWLTDGIRPGVVACSHHVGRWRMFKDVGGQKLSTSLVDITREGDTFLFRQKESVKKFDSNDADTDRIWWTETGVNQNLTFPVQPDPISGMHCWHQAVRVEPAYEGDRYADIFVDTSKSYAVYDAWKDMTKPAPGPGGLRRPLWLNRPLRPVDEAYQL